VISRRAACEFPNDNPELHDGIVWSCPEPCARPLPTLRIRPTAGELPKVLGPAWHAFENAEVNSERDGKLRLRPSETEPLQPSSDGAASKAPSSRLALSEPRGAVTPEVSASPEGPFERFVATVARVAMSRGATRAAGAVTALLTLGRLVRDGVDPALLDTLARRKILSASGQVTPEFAAAAQAWRAVLEGSGGDLSGCGNATLDAWAAELLAAVMNVPRDEANELKRELRRSGVAAFGLLAVA
jgi:hypothetical protein